MGPEDRFIEEHVSHAPPQHMTLNVAVWDAYREWAYTRVQPPDQAKRYRLTHALKARGFVQGHTHINGHKRRIWFGLALKEVER
jgi:hypothetical protein